MAQLLCESCEITEGQCKSIQTDGNTIFILRKDGRTYAYVNACPHLGVPLNWLPDQFFDADGELIQCAMHGAMFIPESGLCVSGPCIGQHLKPFSIIENDGHIFASSENHSN